MKLIFSENKISLCKNDQEKRRILEIQMVKNERCHRYEKGYYKQLYNN